MEDKLSIVEEIVTGFYAYWNHQQSLDQLRMPFGSPDVYHFAMVKLVDMLHSAKELNNMGR